MRMHYETIDEYISTFPTEVQSKLEKIRAFIHKTAPEATEAIKYQIPTFALNGNLVHFAAFKTHIGFYPTSSPMGTFKKDLEKYKTSKGAIQFPIDEPIPFGLIEKIVKFRVKENKERAQKKA